MMKRKTGRKRFSKWMFPLIGIVSFIWFLIRVLPKPSRAAYPCQRVAAPLAASFVMWIAGLFGTAFAYRRWQIAILQHRRLVTVLCAVAALVAGIVTVTNMPRSARAEEYPAYHTPIGIGQGIHPGRVVWVYNPGATNWAGFSSTERWYEDAHTDPLIVERMVSQSIRALAGKNSDAQAWDDIFRYYNNNHGRGNRGYYPGEKIMIKLNLAVCNVRTNYVPTTTWEKIDAQKNCVDNSPQMIRALLKQLVSVGVSQSNITVGDPTVNWPNCYLAQLRAEYPNVNYLQYTSGPNRVAAQWDTNAKFYWSTSAADGKVQDKLPTAYVQADYLINFAILKGHSAGITLCGKNNYGSLIRLPDGWLNGAVVPNYYNLHYSLPNNYTKWSSGIKRYRAIVDVMGHPGLGDKTLLYLVDGLYGGYYANSQPFKWYTAPFNGDWPSSLFVSQDPVAIDSVGYDFLKAEWPDIVSGGNQWAGSLLGGAEDYLHEAALANAPLSGTVYDPDRDGIAMQSLGVHEHWLGPDDKRYSRNLGLADGIELVSLTYDSGAIQRAKSEGNYVNVLVTGAAVTAAFQDYFYIESDDRVFGIRVNKVAHGLAKGMRVNVSGPIRTNANDERYIAASIISSAGTGTIAPVHMNAKIMVGGNWNYDPDTGSGQSGILGASGHNTIGLLVRAAGRYAQLDNSTFTVNDGELTVKCVVPLSVTLDPSWTHVGVTGISSCEKINGELHRLILVSEQSDIAAYWTQELPSGKRSVRLIW